MNKPANLFLISSIFLLLFLLAFFCYREGLRGGFIFDDLSNIVHNESLGRDSILSVILSGTSGPLKRPLSYLSFHLNVLTTGYNPYFFKLTNLAIHFINTIMVFMISREIYSKLAIDQNNNLKLAIISASVFLFHPLALTGVLYAVQRMASLSAFFVLLGIYFFLKYRREMIERQTGLKFIISGTLLCTLLAIFTKENGILLPYFCVLIEIVFFRWKNIPLIQKRLLQWLCAALILAPIFYQLAKFFHHPDWLFTKHPNRTFTVLDRLMTETRVIWFYLRLVVLPDIRLMALFHDDIPISTDLMTPPTTLPSIIGLLALTASAFALKKNAPAFSFGVLFFLLGHSIESSFVMLEIAHEHRNYLPMIGILISGVYYLDKLVHRTRHKILSYALYVTLVGSLAVSTSIRANHWSNFVDQTLMDVYNHPGSARNNLQAGIIFLNLYKNNQYDKKRAKFLAIKYLNRAYELEPQNPAMLLSLIHGSYLLGNSPTFEDYQKLNALLSNQPIPNIFFNTLSNFTTCTLIGICSPSNAEISEIYNRILYRSPGSIHEKAATLGIASNYYATRKEYITAIRYLYYLLDYKDDVKARTALCESLINVHFFDEAQDQIEILKARKDRLLFQQIIINLEESLENARKKSSDIS